ncbi:mannosyl-3-phosphoglycerate phosphatase [Pacificibacter maritimus]|uniref:Mannosyl-3-phosphoglycerate phosphatase n=1 Tax=Pacificibacter maritimus TaxID=762213 RepID=A0A3N4V058_9RHOB|nr:HAD-IIB family hydrolase [Pacificibacter maritimus]RPE67240.1 mannosyl-3-phosphoglycerate phosphatase [Pacificibacter maritimus]
MKDRLSLLIFTDLDGTLIDHDTYQWSPAFDALNALKAAQAGVVLASSKTGAEISVLRDELGLNAWPAIVENGAGLLAAHATVTQTNTDYRKLRNCLNQIPKQLRQSYVGFGDMTTDEVVQATGLDAESAKLAQQRMYSEPGLWHGTQEDKHRFLAQLKTHGISAQQGGRFLTLSFGTNKVDQMQRLTADFMPRHTIALGDAPNDIAMIEAADFGVVIANPHRSALKPLKGEAEGRIRRTQASGPRGWNTAILDLLTQLELT